MRAPLRRRLARSAALAAAVASAVVMAVAPGAQASTMHVAAHYALTDLGPLPGGSTSRAAGLNSTGVAVGYSDDGGCAVMAVVWNPAPVSLGSLPGASSCMYANGINDADHVAGSRDISGGAGCYQPFRSDLATISLIDFLPGDTCGDGLAINSSDVVVGDMRSSDSHRDAFLSAPGSATANLGNLGGDAATALAINDAQQVVGTAATPSTPAGDMWDPGHAFLWTETTGMRDLNVGGPRLWELRQANAIASDGAIVGFGTHRGILRAFLRTAGGTVHDLGTFPGGGISEAFGVNRAHEVVGLAYLDATGVGNNRAMAWTSTDGMVNLNDRIDPSLGWLLAVATGVNRKGQISGYGVVGGQTHGFLLTPTS